MLKWSESLNPAAPHEMFSVDWVRLRLAQYEPVETARQQRAAVAFIFRPQPDGLELLFIRRAKQRQDPWSGQMALPGGRAEPQDSDSLATAVRETAEEVGIELSRQGTLLGRSDDQPTRPKTPPLIITPFVFSLEELLPVRPAPAEVDAIFWFDVAELACKKTRSTYRHVAHGNSLDFPCLRLAGQTIWGLTYQMMARLFAILDWVQLPRMFPAARE